MLFASPTFALFGVVFFGVHLALPNGKVRWVWGVAMSSLFYGMWNPAYLLLMWWTIVLDYFLGLYLGREEDAKKRKWAVVGSLVSNLGLLGYFKYASFTVESFNWFAARYGLVAPDFVAHVVLPVGISFYTFQSLSYTLDVYKKEIPSEPSFLRFSYFVTFFPQLVAGPIVRASHFLGQIQRPLALTPQKAAMAMVLIASGIGKKAILSDRLSMVVDPVFDHPLSHQAWELWMGAYLYAYQIYFDFSGYSETAIGLSLMAGFTLPANFNYPYASSSPREFWRRWHISLSTWLRDYLYVPLGGNQFGLKRMLFALMVTMLLGGFWHGAGWNFILWGLWHGGLLCVWRLVPGLEKLGRLPSSWRDIKGLIRWGLMCCVTFHLVVFGWVLFRSPNATFAWHYLRGMVTVSDGGADPMSIRAFGLLGLVFLLHLAGFWTNWKERLAHMGWFVRWSLIGVVFWIVLMFAVDAKPFIYFQF